MKPIGSERLQALAAQHGLEVRRRREKQKTLYAVGSDSKGLVFQSHSLKTILYFLKTYKICKQPMSYFTTQVVPEHSQLVLLNHTQHILH